MFSYKVIIGCCSDRDIVFSCSCNFCKSKLRVKQNPPKTSTLRSVSDFVSCDPWGQGLQAAPVSSEWVKTFEDAVCLFSSYNQVPLDAVWCLWIISQLFFSCLCDFSYVGMLFFFNVGQSTCGDHNFSILWHHMGIASHWPTYLFIFLQTVNSCKSKFHMSNFIFVLLIPK